MTSENNYRLYSFVANHYLSPLQHGLQTAHVVSELFSTRNKSHLKMLKEWARKDKTIIICAAGNQAGVLSAFEELVRLCGQPELDLPVALFSEDENSMNGMATACGVLVPEEFWNDKIDEYYDACCAGDFMDLIQNAKLA